MGAQDYHFGRPIMPEELTSMPYGDVRKVVMAAINGLGPSNAEETVLPGDNAFEKNVRDWSKTVA